MKNIKLFPFERNRYFFGKLLTVNDFETEQKYFNDKRRLINRTLFGTGVVTGLSAMKVDSGTIVVESGFAIDGTGREIVVDKAVLKKLSMIDGFSDGQNEIQPFVYLCIEYDELKSEPVHSLSDSVLSDEAYNKYAEGYRFYLTTDEPKEEECGVVSEYFQSTAVVYEGNGIRVKHICPKYTPCDKEFDMIIEIEKINQPLKFKLEYELDLLWISDDEGKINFTFDENAEADGQHYYTKKLRLKASTVDNVNGTIAIKENSMKLTLEGGLEKQLEPDGSNNINLLSQNLKDKFIEDFFSQSLEHITEKKAQERLYLAKIYLVRWGDSYEIGDIIKMPFNQYVTNNEMNRIFAEMAFERLKQKDFDSSTEAKQTLSSGYGNGANQVRSGVVSIELGENSKEGQVFFSKDISHGFGLSEVHIILSRVDNIAQSSDFIFGDTGIFLSSKNDVQASLAAKTDSKKGVFKIGVRLLANTDERKIDISWLAIKDFNADKGYTDSKQITIRPDLTYVNARQTVWLEAVVEGLQDKNVTWTVKESGGGFVDKRGLYTAPNNPGVYEVVAQSVSNPEVRASAFIAVKKS